MLLCDTSALLWVLVDSPQLGRRSRTLVTGRTDVYVSAVSVVELAIKQMLGKLVAPDDLSSAIEQQSFRQLPLDVADADAVRDFPELVGHDPFDRMLVAQAHARGMDFLTSDRRLLALGRANILDATS